MTEGQTVPGELGVHFIFVRHVVYHQVVAQTQAETPRKIHEARIPGKLRQRDRPIINAAEVGRAICAKISFVKVKDEGYGEDRDDDHQPSMMFAKNSDHKRASRNSGGGKISP